MSNTPIELKGSNFTLSVLHLNDGAPKVIRQAISEKIAQAPQFLKNAPVVINVSAIADQDIDFKKLRRIVEDAGLRVVGISGSSDAKQKEAIIAAQLPILNEGKITKPATSANSAQSDNDTTNNEAPAVVRQNTKIIHTPVRSGQRIYAQNSDLIVTSNVSAGAELIADGNVHVYGILRGRVLAGASGDVESHIFCTHLSAELVSIAGQYWLSDQIPTDFVGKSVQLSLQENELTIENLI
ncbi:septum site-determining protein MinC [Proteus myxofaciens]|uniref:Probable septum site-determining protein MinC n=1 Tax=Proteus myxofaciens ATCC 19692 TaxID=1354337 RepID=A0A198GPU7_9GAMM|nr:septum site-determining protein MinC [Proteus myxofaciens]OAT38885.1 MinC family septum site-determining protein [Proteus myxofaciens ATCC 19692]